MSLPSVIHSIFDTDHRDWRINNTSSYMDLSPLYGGNAGYGAKTVLDMRCLDGSGKIWADTFADHRLLYMPPATAVVLILLNRNHNVRPSR
jgi:linoleate 10R-lipoxygenase